MHTEVVRDVRSPGLLIATLSVVVLSVGLIQTSVVPVLGVIAEQLDASELAVSWVVTANLLAAVAATPVIGRLADLRTKKRVLLATLALVLAGSVLAATTSSLAMLLLGRILQGTSFALYPVAVSILRDEVPGERLARAVAMLSAMVGVGVGLALVINSLLMTQGASYHRVFWFCAAFTAAVAVGALVSVPCRPRNEDAPVDWAGAAALAVGLSALLLALTQGRSWGWSSPATTTTAVLGLAVLAAWSRRNLHHPHPLIPATSLADRRILLTNLATLLAGAGLYFSLLCVTDRVEAPKTTGYGLGATVENAGLEFLLPGALAAAATALFSGRCVARFGPRAVMAAAGGCGVVGFMILAESHSAPWHIVVAAVLTNAYVSLAYAASPAMMLRDVDHRDMGALTALNTVVRPLGASVAAAAVAALLAPARGEYGSATGFTAASTLGAVSAAATILLVLAVRPVRVG